MRVQCWHRALKPVFGKVTYNLSRDTIGRTRTQAHRSASNLQSWKENGHAKGAPLYRHRRLECPSGIFGDDRRTFPEPNRQTSPARTTHPTRVPKESTMIDLVLRKYFTWTFDSSSLHIFPSPYRSQAENGGGQTL